MKENTNIATPWFDVYSEISRLLNQHYQVHEAKSGNELFERANESYIYKKHNGSWINNALRRNKPAIDPIQFFMSFNRSKQTAQDRIEVINTAVALLDSEAYTWNQIDFTGCPTPVAFKIQGIRSLEEQQQIWKAFHLLAENGREILTSKLWAQAHSWEGIQTSAFTIFLFWIRSDAFLPLDKNTKRFLEISGYLAPRTNINFETYQSLLSIDFGINYRELSAEAFSINKLPESGEIQKKYEWKTSLDVKDVTFRLIGIRTLENNPEAHKILKPNTYYPFDQVILPTSTDIGTNDGLDSFNYNPSFSESLYRINNLKLNLSAIVGKNGSGKSSLVDLLLMGIYNLSVHTKLLQKKEPALSNLQFELYWHSDTLYKLRFSNRITLHRFKYKINEMGEVRYESEPQELPIQQVDKYFFYSILINYSHYALNGSEMKIDWVTPLSHKNDGYLAPVVINPQRTDGNININREKELLNMRLLLNLLELHEPDYPQDSFRYLDNGKYIQYFSLTLNKSKNQTKRQELLKGLRINNETTNKSLVQVIASVYNLDLVPSSGLPFISTLYMYTVHKLWRIANQYLPVYKTDFFETVKILNQPEAGNDIALVGQCKQKLYKLLEHIQSTPSHFTIKFKQAINFLRYPQLQQQVANAIKSGAPISLDDYNQQIDDIMLTNLLADKQELLPPAIFKLDFHLEDNKKSSFQQASSGEYQLVSVLSSILYHIRNIESNITDTNGYQYVSILLDEIELYFHPNMQRHFVKRLLHALSQLETKLEGVHILFSTHSPFILSDLQQSKILKLKKGTIDKTGNGYNTFAANIHDLLADEFFLEDGYMGAFAQKHIEVAIQQLNYRRVQREIKQLNNLILTDNERTLLRTKLDNELELYLQRLKHPLPWEDNTTIISEDLTKEKSFIARLIDTIGEPLIRENLRSMYQTAYPEAQLENVKAIIRDMMKKNNITSQEIE